MGWNDILKRIKDSHEDRKLYFSKQKDEILTSNLLVFKRLSLFCVIAVILFVLMEGIYKHEWNITIFQIIIIFLLFIHVVISRYITRHRLKHKVLEKAACVTFSLCVFLMLIYIDTVESPANFLIFSSAFLVIAPAIYIMSASRMIVDQLFFVIVYAFFAFTFKEKSIAIEDMYAILAGFFFGIILYSITSDLRLKVNSEVIKFKHFSEIDELTKIKNRRAANAQISYMIEKSDIDSCNALLMLDVDMFKKINDTYGHKVGDQVLVEVAKILTGVFRKDDAISRFGGDEFIVFVSGFSEMDFIKTKCQEIQNRVNNIIPDKLRVTCSIGICISTEGHHTMDDMVRVADEALYKTKETKRGTYTINYIN